MKLNNKFLGKLLPMLLMVFVFTLNANANNKGKDKWKNPHENNGQNKGKDKGKHGKGDSVPLDGGLGILLAGAGFYGVKKLRKG